MVDISHTILAKSDQLNADDLIAGPITIKITGVSLAGEEQPVKISYEGDKGKPYCPCKSMRRVLVFLWGGDSSNYVGKSLTLYRDPAVKFGGLEVGGIRISHASHIKSQISIPLTKSRGAKVAFIVKPLEVAQVQDIDPQSLRASGEAAALKGMEALQKWFAALTSAEKKLATEYKEELKATANSKGAENE